MSDIHGRYDEYLEMLLKINFSRKDKLYILGDVIDRGQNPIKVLRHTMYADNIILLMGNHEKMMLDSASTDEEKRAEANDMWEWNGGYTTKREFFELSKEVRQEIIDYIAELKWYEFVEIGDKKFFLSHAALCMRDGDSFEETLENEVKSENILWNRGELRFWENTSDYIFVHGHTPSGKWHPFGFYEILTYDEGKKINIDCGCAKIQRLGCLRLDDMCQFYVECDKNM